MNAKGLKELWQVGKSKKRKAERFHPRLGEYSVRNRKQIGKFGIGKLSTYIITTKLTYLTKTESGFYATTMDYSKLPPEDVVTTSSDTPNVSLSGEANYRGRGQDHYQRVYAKDNQKTLQLSSFR